MSSHNSEDEDMEEESLAASEVLERLEVVCKNIFIINFMEL